MDLSHLEQEKKQQVEELKVLHESGDLSHDEYVELVEDILDLEKISGMLDTEEKKIIIEKAFLAIKTASGLVK